MKAVRKRQPRTNTAVHPDVAALFSSCRWLRLGGDAARRRNRLDPRFRALGAARGCVLREGFARLEQVTSIWGWARRIKPGSQLQ